MGAEASARYKEVQGLSRGLEVLRVMNTGRGGEFDVADVAQQTGIHRTTVRRLLETLLSNGYVRRSRSDGTFRLALRVRALSEGFTDDEWISAAAPPVLGDLLRAVVWPTDLCTAEGASMVIRETTHRFSPLSFHRSMVGVRMPMLFTATGRAYISFCPDAECHDLLEIMRAGNDPQARVARSPKAQRAAGADQGGRLRLEPPGMGARTDGCGDRLAGTACRARAGRHQNRFPGKRHHDPQSRRSLSWQAASRRC